MYNEFMNKKVTAKTVQITKPELVKCRDSQEFKVNMVTFAKPKPPIIETDGTDEPIIHGGPYDRNLPPPEPKPPRSSLAIVVKMLTVMQDDISGLKEDVSGLKEDVSRLKTDVSGIKTDISDLKIRMINVETKLTNVITLNQLRS
ncbi:hypothetical protein FACS1894166_07090 [Bacilli bacterium]|nr:hypothetical protein FACS1894166_07090 [Bacilli bacterium]